MSVTTIPAAAGIGVSLASSDWDQARGSLAQLLLDMALLIVVGVLTLRFHRFIRRRIGPPRRALRRTLGPLSPAPEARRDDRAPVRS
ncbi:hypothetical protein [Streptomyces sp. bgisy027]|uniref:hypothetical protein n=1 Tax=Streptomyces sp. bgisy027 TaxID=3413770 RepID=UPI003D73B300